MEHIITFEWGSVMTEASLATFAAITLVFSAIVSTRRRSRWISILAMFFITLALGIEIFYPSGDGLFFGELLGKRTNFGVFALACGLLTALMSFSYFSKGEKCRNEFLSVLMICVAALMLFVRANNLMFAFIALECATICLYIMAAWSKNTASSLEGATKYLVVSGVSGAMFLLGVAFIYGAGLSASRNLLNFENFSMGLMNQTFIIGLVLVCAGVLFKIAAFPFQFWSPDVYQGSPTPVSAFFAVASKGAGIVFFAKICSSLDFASMGFAHMHGKMILAISIIAALTIIVGNLGAITQIKVKRLMAFSGIANAGYLLVLVAAALSYSEGLKFFELALYFYLAAYMFANYAIFFVINQFVGSDDSDMTMADYRGLVSKSSVMETTLIVNLASLAGIPPTAGFFGKVIILIIAWFAQMYWLMGIMIAGSVISIYYYFSWMRASLDSAEGGEREIIDNSAFGPTMIALTVSTLLFGVSILYYVGL